VGFLEGIAKSAGYDRVKIKKNTNPGFWRKMGYKKNEKKLY